MGRREGVHTLSCLRIWLGIKAYTDVHGVRATRLRPGPHTIVVRITARTKRDIPERVPNALSPTEAHIYKSVLRFFLVVKPPEHEAKHSPSSSAGKNVQENLPLLTHNTSPCGT